MDIAILLLTTHNEMNDDVDDLRFRFRIAIIIKYLLLLEAKKWATRAENIRETSKHIS